jgi:hypothetical protein
MNEPRICRDLYNVLNQHFPAGTKTMNSLSQDKRIPRIATSPFQERKQLIFTVRASVLCKDTVFLVDEAALK